MKLCNRSSNGSNSTFNESNAGSIKIYKAEVVRDDVGGYSKIQLGEFPAGPVNCRSGSGPSRPASVGRTRGPNRDAQSQVQQLSQFEIRENEPIRSGEDRYRAVELITSAR